MDATFPIYKLYHPNFCHRNVNAKIVFNAMRLVAERGLGARFYAADLGENGMTGVALAAFAEATHDKLIRRTGNTREAFIEIDDDIYRKVSAQEWEIVPNQREWENFGNFIINEVHGFINGFLDLDI